MLSSQTEQLLVGEHSSLSTLLANNGQTRHAVRQATLVIGLASSAALSAWNSGEKPEQGRRRPLATRGRGDRRLFQQRRRPG